MPVFSALVAGPAGAGTVGDLSSSVKDAAPARRTPRAWDPQAAPAQEGQEHAVPVVVSPNSPGMVRDRNRIPWPPRPVLPGGHQVTGEGLREKGRAWHGTSSSCRGLPQVACRFTGLGGGRQGGCPLPLGGLLTAGQRVPVVGCAAASSRVVIWRAKSGPGMGKSISGWRR